jgi:uncharacterized protein YlaN (UPF0358 family)
MQEIKHIKSMIDRDIEMLQSDISKLAKLQKKIEIETSNALMCECGCYESNVIDTRDEKNTRVRRRKCKYCGKKWTTIEVRK